MTKWQFPVCFVGLFGKNKSLASQCNRAKKSKKDDDTDNIKAWPDAHLNDFSKVALFTILPLTFHMFKSNQFIEDQLEELLLTLCHYLKTKMLLHQGM
jgi:hypothetical protein